MPKRKVSRFQDLPPRDTKDYQLRLDEWTAKQSPEDRKHWEQYKGATKRRGLSNFI